MGIVRAVCVSDRRGIQKRNVKSAELIADWGVSGDAHGGGGHRQVSLLSYNKVQEFNSLGADVGHGDFGENLVVEGIDFRALPVGTRLRCNDALLEITQIGKACHKHCNIYHKTGDCIMPREGVFAKVIIGGVISEGDEMVAEKQISEKKCAAVVTLSDRCASGEREDKSGALIEQMLAESGYNVFQRLILPDERGAIEDALIDLCDRRHASLILTTGGTGFSVRDVTPEATLAVAERNAPGIAEAIRGMSMKITGRAMLGRGVSVIRGGTLIVNLPGSPKAVREGLEFILPHLGHGLDVLNGGAPECGRTS